MCTAIPWINSDRLDLSRVNPALISGANRVDGLGRGIH